MSEEFLSGNHTTEGQQVEGQQVQQQVETTPVTTQDNFFEVKYNKEPVRVSYDEAPTYIQKGLNYDKVHQQYEQQQQRLNDLTQFYGYQTEDELWQALEYSKQEQQRQAYEQAGINPDLLNQAIESHPAVQYAKSLEAKQHEESKFNQEASELFSEFPDLKAEQIPPEAFQLRETKGLSLLDSYLRVTYKSLAQQKEQEALQKLNQNALSTPGSLGAGAEHKTGYSNLSASDKKSLRDRVLRGEQIEL